MGLMTSSFASNHFAVFYDFVFYLHELSLFLLCICVIGKALFGRFSKPFGVTTREIFGVIEAYFVGNLCDVAVMRIAHEDFLRYI